jgi:hypothetical protein
VGFYPYLGIEQRFYTQYLDVTGGGQKPLVAKPGESYEIAAAPGQEKVAVPPSDGRWGDETAKPSPKAKPDDKTPSDAATAGKKGGQG